MHGIKLPIIHHSLVAPLHFVIHWLEFCSRILFLFSCSLINNLTNSQLILNYLIEFFLNCIQTMYSYSLIMRWFNEEWFTYCLLILKRFSDDVSQIFVFSPFSNLKQVCNNYVCIYLMVQLAFNFSNSLIIMKLLWDYTLQK